eukprot:UN00243
MQAYFSAVAKAYPKTVGPAWKNIMETGATKPIEDVRIELYQKRFEYWYRKVSMAGANWNQAKKDFADVRVALRNPSELTYKQVGTAAVWGVHVFGSFCIGEMFGRGCLAGYPVGANVGHH